MSKIIYTESTNRKRNAPHRKKKVWHFRVFILGCVFLVVIVALYTLRLPYWRIKNINITGIETLREDEIRNYLAENMAGNIGLFIPRNAFFFVRSAELAASLKKTYVRLETADVEKKFPDTLIVTLRERRLFGILCRTDEATVATNTIDSDIYSETQRIKNCAYLDRTGFAYEQAPESSGGLIIKINTDAPEVRIPSQVFDTTLIDHILFLDREIARVTGVSPIEYTLHTKIPSEIRTKTQDGYTLILKRNDDFQNVFRVLHTVLEEEIKENRTKLDYIDLRFGNKVFYKFK